jgi:hypothetical protein
MEDDLNFCKWEEDLNFLQMEDELNFWKVEDNFNFWEIEDDLNYFIKTPVTAGFRRRPQFFLLMNDDLNFRK